MSEDDLTSQSDEIAALTAIFGPENWVPDVTRPIEAFPQYSIVIRPDDVLSAVDPGAADKSVTLRVTFPPSYPSASPPAYELGEAHWLSRSQRQKIRGELEELYFENMGENVVFVWIDKIRELLNEIVAEESGGGGGGGGGGGAESPFKIEGRTDVDENVNSIVGDFNEQLDLDDETLLIVDDSPPAEDDDDAMWDLPEIFSGEPITDRKSTFQAFLAQVVHQKQAMCVLEKLKQNKKIANATHNMWAFRIGGDAKSKSPSPLIARCDDDGETHAGSRMLHLLEILDAANVIVVVSRWYGGIQLGPDRFKHISNLTRNILEQNGFIKEKKESGVVGGKSGKRKT